VKASYLASTNTVREIKSKRIGWTGRGTNAYRDRLENLSVNERIILKWIFLKYNVKPWIGFHSG
jgi:hypothetical protein